MRIQRLPTLVANQIAAGEVIERPASVVKELLENSLDAGADSIHIEIGFGGLNQVKISDNGVGICADDLELAVAAHATSKIRQLQDLYTATSMGFRGEALASIAAVSRLTISSKPVDQAHAMRLHVVGSTMDLSPCARSFGTTIDVRDLFFNAPVRKKFLKTPRGEYLAIEAIVKRFALSAPFIALTLIHDDKLIMTLPAATCDKTRLARIKKILGKSFVEQAVYLDTEQAGMRLLGWVCGEGYQRSQSDRQWVYLNQRMVKDKLIQHALKQAYDGLLHPGRYPACLLYLTVPAAEVDVNVHPTKHEVRFQQPRLVHDFISSTLVSALSHVLPRSTSGEEVRGEATLGFRVDEVQVSQSLRTLPFADSFEKPVWIVINSRFIMTFLQNVPYLVDWHVVLQHRLSVLMEEQSWPLASRPLLVPMSYAVNQSDAHWIDINRNLFEQVGMQIDWVSDTRVMIRSIPQLFQNMDIKQCLEYLNVPMLTHDALIKHCMMSQSYDASQGTSDEKSWVIAYLEAHVCDTKSSWFRRLDIESCLELMHG